MKVPPRLEFLAYNKILDKSLCSEIIMYDICKKAVLLIERAYTKARRNPRFCIPHPKVYYEHKSAPCKYPPINKEMHILMTKNCLVRCLIAKIKQINSDCWPPLKLTMWNVTAFLNGIEDPFKIPSDFEMIGSNCENEISIDTFISIFYAAIPALSRKNIEIMYRYFLESEGFAAEIYNQSLEMALTRDF